MPTCLQIGRSVPQNTLLEPVLLKLRVKVTRDNESSSQRERYCQWIYPIILWWSKEKQSNGSCMHYLWRCHNINSSWLIRFDTYHVHGCAHRIGARVKHSRGHACNAKVPNFDGIAAHQEHVGCFDVPMHHTTTEGKQRSYNWSNNRKGRHKY
jgi:hypothetical protein